MSRFLRRAAPAEPAAPRGPATSAPLHAAPSELKPTPRAPLSAEQLKFVAALRAHVEALHEAGWVQQSDGETYRPWERVWLDDEGTVLRYARASKWDLENAKKRIADTLAWRRSYRPELITPDEIAEEAKTGKQIISGFDQEGRPILYLRPGRENTQPSPQQVRFLVFALERALDLAPNGQDTLAIVVDYASATQATNPSISQARKVLNILQAHYVERMGRAFVVNVPWWINAFFTALSPFLDPATREKIKFNASLSSFIAPEQLDAEFGGAHNYQWDFDAYWSSLLDAANLLPDGTRRVGARRAVAEACTAPPLPGREAESTPTPAPPYASSVDAVAEPTSSSSPAAAAAATATDGETLSRFLSHTHRTENASAEGSAVGSTVESHLTETRGETAPSTAPTSVHGHEQIKPVS